MSKNNLTVNQTSETIHLADIHLSSENEKSLYQFIEEYKHIEVLRLHKLPVDNKILLYGSSGCGKTITANAIAKELKREILTLDLGGFVSSRLGETGKNILTIFHQANRGKKVLFIDEFDFLGASRSYGKEDSASGEMKRLVNTVIQQIDHLNENCLLIAATNHLEAVDSALLRRFQLRLKYEMPDKGALELYYDQMLAAFPDKYRLIKRQFKISYAEAKDLIYKEVKSHIIEEELNRKAAKKQHLFSYDSLRLENVQIEMFGRKLKGNKDKLIHYKLTEVDVLNEDVNSQSERKNNTSVEYTGNSEDFIEGVIFEISDEELIMLDEDKVGNQKRELRLFESGNVAWVYVVK